MVAAALQYKVIIMPVRRRWLNMNIRSLIVVKASISKFLLWVVAAHTLFLINYNINYNPI